ncbi:MAG: CDP-alcohol phosphatidyltransferase family protein [Phycisphaerae bacterium]|nr:CDP-alcohol phosphatidyltransferase family protein [Phycisphaerae bacterium]
MAKLKMAWPNRITLMRILLVWPFIYMVLKINQDGYENWARYAALIIFAIMAISDGLDGYCARKFNMVTELGAFLDPLADKLLITSTCILLSLQRNAINGMVLPVEVVVLIIGKDILVVMGFIVIYFMTGKTFIVPVKIGKYCTAVQLIMVLFMLISPDITPFWSDFIYCIRALWCLSSALAIASAITYIRNGIKHVNEYEHNKQSGND